MFFLDAGCINYFKYPKGWHYFITSFSYSSHTAKVGISPKQANSIVLNTRKVGITEEQADAITANATNTVRNTSEIAELKPTLEALGQNDTAIGEQLTALGQNDTAIGEQITKLGQNDESIMAEINAMENPASNARCFSCRKGCSDCGERRRDC